MSNEFAKTLGSYFAEAHYELSDNNCDDENLERIERFSKIYNNFSTGDMPDFRKGFQEGYDQGRRELRELSETTPQAVELGDEDRTP